jgi:3-methyladenine DNA glycosylase AlkC
MAAGSLTSYFGKALAELLAEKLKAFLPEFSDKQLYSELKDLDKLTLMNRIHLLADSLAPILPADATDAWSVMEKIQGPPLREDQQIFNDGYWMLPLADYWSRHHIDSFEIAVTVALEALTRRGTSEFAVRPFFHTYPEKMKAVLKRWVRHSCFHVRRLATEGSRPYLPWGGRLRVDESTAEEYLRIISDLKSDPSSYVRRSVGNHVRDWRRINANVADQWIAAHKLPKDVLRLALPRKKVTVA